MGIRRRGLEGRGWSWSSGRGVELRTGDGGFLGSPQGHVTARRPHAAQAQDEARPARGKGRSHCRSRRSHHGERRPRRPYCARAAPPPRQETNGLAGHAPDDAVPAPWRRAAAEQKSSGLLAGPRPGRGLGSKARRHEANAEDGPVTGQGLGAAQRAETQLLVRSRSWAVPAARTPALGPPPSGDSVLGWGPTPGTLSLR